jgi:hypothetical protein
MNPKQFRAFRSRVLARMQLASAAAIAKSANVHVCSRTCNIPGSLIAECDLCRCVIYYTDLQYAGLRKVCLECAERMPEFDQAEFLAQRNSVWDQYPEN